MNDDAEGNNRQTRGTVLYIAFMAGNTTTRSSIDRRSSKRVPVLFSAILNRKGWRSQIVEVIDLSENGAKIQVRFEQPVGTEVVLKMPGPRHKLEIPCVVANLGEMAGQPISGLRFSVPEDIREELKEIVVRVDSARHRAALEASVAVEAPAAPAARSASRVTRRTTRSRKSRPAPGHDAPEKPAV